MESNHLNLLKLADKPLFFFYPTKDFNWLDLRKEHLTCQWPDVLSKIFFYTYFEKWVLVSENIL